MVTRKSNKQTTTPADTESTPSATPAEAVTEPSPIERQNQQIVELQQLTSGLADTIASMKAQNARDVAFLRAVEGVERATEAVLRTPAIGAQAIESGAVPSLVHGEKECGCGPCDCVSERCCTFNIIMSHIRVTHMQIEPMDTNLNPLAKMEVRFFPNINGIGPVYPSLWGHVPLHKTLLNPGVWERVNVFVGTVQVCKSQPKRFPIELNVVEVDSIITGVIEAITGLRDEYGTNTDYMTLECCCGTTPTLDIEVQFTGGSQLAHGAVQARFIAEKQCN